MHTPGSSPPQIHAQALAPPPNTRSGPCPLQTHTARCQDPPQNTHTGSCPSKPLLQGPDPPPPPKHALGYWTLPDTPGLKLGVEKQKGELGTPTASIGDVGVGEHSIPIIPPPPAPIWRRQSRWGGRTPKTPQGHVEGWGAPTNTSPAPNLGPPSHPSPGQGSYPRRRPS